MRIRFSCVAPVLESFSAAVEGGALDVLYTPLSSIEGVHTPLSENRKQKAEKVHNIPPLTSESCSQPPSPAAEETSRIPSRATPTLAGCMG